MLAGVSLILLATLSLPSQEIDRQHSWQDEQIKRELVRKNPRAVFEARRSKNPDLIPYLKQLLKDPEFQLNNFEWPELDVTLAQLNDRETLQTYVCAIEIGPTSRRECRP